MPTKLLFPSRVGFIAVILTILLSACVTSLTPQPTDNPVTLTAKAASPTPVVPSATVAPTPPETPAPAASPDPCSALNLTPEECANQGTHRYSVTYEELNGCETTSENRVGDWTTSFDQEGIDMGDGQAERQGPNTFLYVRGPEATTIIIFSLDGYVEEDYFEDVLCVRTTYELIQ
jgi:hypothetical protein